MSNIFTLSFLITFAIATIKTLMPVFFAGLGEVYSERAGIININLEGQMLAGAFFAYYFAQLTGSLLIGTIAAGFSGLVFALIFGYGCIIKKASQIVAGIALNILVLGLTSFLNHTYFSDKGLPPNIGTYSNLPIPLLHKIPVIGPIFFNQSIVVYVGVLLAVLSYVIIFKTTFGLKLRSVGENPRAAETTGISVPKTQFISLMICGFLAGIGGAYLTLGMLGRFMDNISNSRGFIALALVIFAQWHPIKIIPAALLFGGASALQMRLQAMGVQIPYQFLMSLPYVLTIIILIITGNRAQAPESLGVSYHREGE